jgi:Zn-dependent protease
MTSPPEPARPARPPPGHGHSLQLARVAGIPIWVHWTFAVLLGLVVVADWHSGWTAVATGLVWIVALFSSVLVHEFSHCYVARRRGANVVGILLIPLGGISQLTAMPESPDDELAVAAVGPLTSLALGAVLLVIGALAGSGVWPPTLFAGSWWARLGWLNLFLGAFNLLPALPMDGGRVLRADLARHRSKLEATLVAGRIARVLAVAMIIVGLVYDFWLLLIGIFVYLGARGEEEAARHPSAGDDQRTGHPR